MTSRFKQTFEEMTNIKGFWDFCKESYDDFDERIKDEDHIYFEEVFYAYESKSRFDKMLIDVLLDEETVLFYPIPKIYLSSHHLLMIMGIYKNFDFNYIKKYAQFNEMLCDKKRYI